MFVIVNLQRYELKDVILASGALTQEISSIVIFIVVFVYLDSGPTTVSIAVCTSIIFITLFLYSTLIILSTRNAGSLMKIISDLLTKSDLISVIDELKSAVIFLISGFAVSPILKTLTETISTDTIYAMVTIMMLVHLIFFNYGADAAIVSTPVALNAAIFAAVCLASRLSTTYHAYALLIFASDIFVLSFILRKRVRDSYSDKWQACLTLFFALSSIILLSTTVRIIYSLLLFLLLLFINFICPLGFYQCQIYKE